MGQMHSRLYGLSVLAVCVAFMVRNLNEALRLRQKELFDVYLSRGDAGRFFALCVEAPAVDFALLYAAGADFAPRRARATSRSRRRLDARHRSRSARQVRTMMQRPRGYLRTGPCR
jgi:uronate dehydrogenase